MRSRQRAARSRRSCTRRQLAIPNHLTYLEDDELLEYGPNDLEGGGLPSILK
ncbi:hypothetical protein ABZ897_50545 [Nonomuraea sp. NPDC046802]|uniref:hypothetical protein n=1 Tax=Nonomuraea sp. NPDC046802 TaxID=3154919 RepID=UPI0033E91962